MASRIPRFQSRPPPAAGQTVSGMRAAIHPANQNLPTRPLPAGTSRVEETEPRFPSHTPLMLLLSLAYIAIALAFGARLPDMVAGNPGDAALGALASWSQTLFGAAVALAVWGALVLPWLETSRLDWRRRWLVLVATGVGAMLLGVLLHRGAAMWLTEDPAGLRGRKAVQLTLLSRAAIDARVNVPELGLTQDQLASPAGKAYLALLLATDMTDPRPGHPSDAAIRQAMLALAAQRAGSAAQVYDNIFVPSVRSLKDAYNAYVAAQLALADDVKAILDQQDRAWNDYVDGLGKRGLSLAKLTRADWPGIVADLRQNGVAIPADWNPADRDTFVAVLSAPQRKQADAQYAERLGRLFGTELPPGLEWDQFHANPIVQARWRAAINAPADATLSPAMGFPAFDENVYRPMIEQIIAPKLRDLLAPPAAFAPGGDMARMAALAAPRIVLPALAMVLVLAGLAWHAAALLAYAARMAFPAWAGRRRSLALALAAAALLVLGGRNPISRTDGFHRLQDDIADRAGPAWLIAHGMVEAYGLGQPWAEAARRTVLGDQDFGLDTRAAPRGDRQAALDQLLP
jgi:hypothetical protein